MGIFSPRAAERGSRFVIARLAAASLAAALPMGLGLQVACADVGTTGNGTTVVADDTPLPRLNEVSMAAHFLETNRPDLAVALLESVYGGKPSNPEVLLIMARGNVQLRRYDLAIAQYRAMIAALPHAPKPKAELASLLLVLGQPQLAQVLYAEAAAESGDSQEKDLLSALGSAIAVTDVASLAGSAQKPWSVELFSGLIYDSNINAGPSSGTVQVVVGGIPLDFTLTKESKPKGSWGVIGSGSGSYTIPLNRNFSLVSQLSLSKTHYFEDGDFDVASVGGGVALVYQDADLSVSVQPNARVIWQDADVDERDIGVTSRGSYRITGNAVEGGFRATGSAGYFYSDNAVDDLQSTHNGIVSAGFAYDFGARVTIGGELMAQRAGANEDPYSFWSYGPVAYVSAAVTDRLQIAATYRFSHSAYDETLAPYPDRRKDNQHLIGLLADWSVMRWQEADLRLRGQYTYIHNASSVAVDDYDRHIAMLGIALKF